ncbi:hypothetical protein TWF281_010886 [Arthrobotrys megalospora]
MSSRTYIVFDQDYAAADLKRLLGAVVVNPSRPLDLYTPKVERTQSLAYIDKYRLAPRKEMSANIETTAIRGTGAGLSLASLFSLDGEWETNDTYKLTSAEITTFSIEQHAEAFKALKAAHGPDINKIFREPGVKGRTVYMLVGFKVAKSPETSRISGQTKKISASVSSEGAVAIYTGIPLPIGAEVSGSKSITWETAVSSFVDEDRAFAGQYIRIVQKSGGITISNGRITLERMIIQKGTASHSKRTLAFSLGSSKDDTDNDGEEGDDDEDDDDEDAIGEHVESKGSDEEEDTIC